MACTDVEVAGGELAAMIHGESLSEEFRESEIGNRKSGIGNRE